MRIGNDCDQVEGSDVTCHDWVHAQSNPAGSRNKIAIPIPTWTVPFIGPLHDNPSASLAQDTTLLMPLPLPLPLPLAPSLVLPPLITPFSPSPTPPFLPFSSFFLIFSASFRAFLSSAVSGAGHPLSPQDSAC